MPASLLIHLPTYPFLATNEHHLGEFQAALRMKQQQSLHWHCDSCLHLSSPVKQDTAHGRSKFDSPSNSSSLQIASYRFLAIMGRATCSSQDLMFGYVRSSPYTLCTAQFLLPGRWWIQPTGDCSPAQAERGTAIYSATRTLPQEQ